MGRHSIDQHGEIRNWESSETYKPARLAKPRSADDIVEILTDTAGYPSPVRAIGSMHSPARCCGDDGGTVVDMTGMDRILDIQPDRVTVEAGALLIDVTQVLAEQGLQFHMNMEIGNITLGAAACGATKDSSIPGSQEFGQQSSYVLGVKLVKPSGEICEITERDNPEDMKLIRSSYGLCGIIYEVTLQVRPLTALSVVHRRFTLERFRAEFPKLVAEGHGLMMYFFPHVNRITVELRQEAPERTPSARLAWSLRNAFWRRYGPLVALTIDRISPTRSIKFALEQTFHFLISGSIVRFVRGRSTHPQAQIIRYPDDPGAVKYVFSMWAFPEEGFFDILEEYFAFCREHYEKTGFKCDLPNVGYRISKDQKALLSYTYDDTVLSIDPVSTGGPGWHDFLRAYNVFCSERGGSPLLNQTKFLTAAQLRKSFGVRIAQFAAARKQWDPSNRLLSSHFEALLADPAAEAEPSAGMEQAASRAAGA
ncbi:MAG: FAD-binding protein [Methyloligellaceae bacterium]